MKKIFAKNVKVKGIAVLVFVFLSASACADRLLNSEGKGITYSLFPDYSFDDSNLKIDRLGFGIGSDLSKIKSVFGSYIFQRADKKNRDIKEICFISNKDGSMLVLDVFRSEVVGFSFFRKASKEKNNCRYTDLVDINLSTESGISLGLVKNDIKRIGYSDHDDDNDIQYEFKFRKKMTEEEFQNITSLNSDDIAYWSITVSLNFIFNDGSLSVINVNRWVEF